MVAESKKVRDSDAELVADSVTWVNVESGKDEGLSTAWLVCKGGDKAEEDGSSID